MKRTLFSATLGAATLAVALSGALVTAPAMAGVSISIGEPGFFGRIDLGGGLPLPQVINTAPVIIAPPPVAVQRRAPIYLRVPPGYERDWAHHCAAYNACGQPVYFVRDDWYRNTYAPHYREHGDPRRNEYWHDDRRGGPPSRDMRDPHSPNDRGGPQGRDDDRRR